MSALPVSKTTPSSTNSAHHHAALLVDGQLGRGVRALVVGVAHPVGVGVGRRLGGLGRRRGLRRLGAGAGPSCSGFLPRRDAVLVGVVLAQVGLALVQRAVLVGVFHLVFQPVAVGVAWWG